MVTTPQELFTRVTEEMSDPIPASPRHPELVDDEYVRKGVASIFLEVEPLCGRRQVKITERRTRIDWAYFIKEILDDRYPEAKKVLLVMNNLNTHGIASLYIAFPANEAKCFADRLENVDQEAYDLARGLLNLYEYIFQSKQS